MAALGPCWLEHLHDMHSGYVGLKLGPIRPAAPPNPDSDMTGGAVELRWRRRPLPGNWEPCQSPNAPLADRSAVPFPPWNLDALDD